MKEDAISFLDETSDQIRSLFAYWDRIRGGKPMPCRADLDPVDIPAHLPGILLIDVEGCDPDGHGIYRYRVVGSKEVQSRGHDPTGKLVQDGHFSASLEETLADYDYTRENQTFLYQPVDFTVDEEVRVREQSILLPFSEDGKTVTQILVYSHPEGQEYLCDKLI